MDKKRGQVVSRVHAGHVTKSRYHVKCPLEGKGVKIGSNLVYVVVEWPTAIREFVLIFRERQVMQPSPGRWPCLSLYLTTPQLAKNGFEIELLVLKIECFYRNYFKRLSLYFDNTTMSLKSFWNPLRAMNVSLHFSTFLIRIPKPWSNCNQQLLPLWKCRRTFKEIECSYRNYFNWL